MKVECGDDRRMGDRRMGDMFQEVQQGFIEYLRRQPHGSEWESVFNNQTKLIEQLINLGETSKNQKGRVEKKVEKMRSLLQNEMKDLRNLPEKIR